MECNEFDYKVDIKETLLYNSGWILMFLLVFTLIFVRIDQAKNFQEDGFRFLYLGVYLVLMTKFLSYLGHPQIRLKRKEDGREKKT